MIKEVLIGGVILLLGGYKYYMHKSEDIGYVTANFEIYDSKREKNIKVYLLNKTNSSNNKVMLVYNNSNKIEDIKIVEISEGLNLLNDFSFFK